MDTPSLLLFIAAGLMLNLTPGPDVLYIVTHAMRSGARAGMVAALGIAAGCFVHISAAALGVSALMAASSTAFTVLKWAGAAYLVYVGGRMLLARQAETSSVNAINSVAAETVNVKTTLLKHIFFQGFWTNVLNPKVALFFLAFVPQFISPGMSNKPLAFLWLGLLFNVNGPGGQPGLGAGNGMDGMPRWRCSAQHAVAGTRGRGPVRRFWPSAGADRQAGGLALPFFSPSFKQCLIVTSSRLRKRCSASSNTAKSSMTKCCT